jgi:radical SAM superfamily enzyme YgiQ (UPF0313 family)
MITLVNCVGPHPDGNAAVAPPGLLTLAAAVREAGFEVRLADLGATGSAGLPTPEEFPQWLGEPFPVVGFSAMSNMLPYALEAARCLKAASPQTTIVLGGCGAQADVRGILTQFPFIDFVFQGEAEQTLPQFLRRFHDATEWRKVDGLAYRENEQVVLNPPPRRIEDLDDLPSPAYDLVDFKAYRDQVGMLTARGCPFSCAYCEGSLFRGERLILHSVSRVFKDIKTLKAYHPSAQIGFVDDTFTVRRSRVVQFCETYAAGEWDFKWGVSARVDGADAELLQLMARHNCEGVFFGVETGTDKMLRAVGKGVTRAQVCEVIPRATGYFRTVAASFIWGFPFEDLHDLEETLMLAAYLATYGAQIQLHLWSPMPRSPLFRQYRDQLVYDPAVQSNMVMGDMTRYQSLVRSNPTLFAPFYHVPHPAMEEKKAMIQGMGFAG